MIRNKSKKQRKTFATMRIFAVFRPFYIDTSINRKNKIHVVSPLAWLSFTYVNIKRKLIYIWEIICHHDDINVIRKYENIFFNNTGIKIRQI